MACERIALVTSADGCRGAEAAGLVCVAVQRPEEAVDAVRRLMAAGSCAVVAVFEDAVAGHEAELAALWEEAPAAASVVLLPAPGASQARGLVHLREGFAAALGVDVWKTAAEKAALDV